MPGLARKSGWNAIRTEPFDFLLHYSNCAVCRYSGATKGTFIQQGCSAFATQEHLYSRAAQRLQPWQVLAPARARRRRTSAASAGASARRLGELALVRVVLTSQRRQPAPAPSAGLAPAHIHVPPAGCSFTPTALMCVTPSRAPMISV